MKSPLVSVIIPTYNRWTLVQEALASVKAQTYSNWEVIVVDDGSTDQTPSLAKDSSVVYLGLEHRGFPGLVRNRGAQWAKGLYLAFLDSDDLWLPKKLELQVAYLEAHPEVNLVHTREIWNRSGKILSQNRFTHRREGHIFADALEKCIIGPSTVVMRKSTFLDLGGFREDLEVAEDYEFWLRLTAGQAVGYLDLPLIEKRAGHGPQLSEKYGHIEIFRLTGLRSLVDRNYFPEDLQPMAKEVLRKKALIYAQGCEKRQRFDEALEWRTYGESILHF